MTGSKFNRATRAGRARLLGVFLLAVGIFASAWIWISQDRLDRTQAGADANDNAPLSALDSRKQVRQIEINYGESGLLLEKWEVWADSLKHGKRLAWTVAVVSVVISAACLFYADWVVPILETPLPTPTVPPPPPGESVSPPGLSGERED